MLLKWVSGAKLQFFPDMKKAACEGSQTAFKMGCFVV
jgi:hypothetical protein